mmetsp:Transcript_14716/g.34409  ORF Transcript_14716/g.34409 Transcript_14716/m.34409 type:complete len:214 (+) Transcript_14716:323-964(+)
MHWRGLLRKWRDRLRRRGRREPRIQRDTQWRKRRTGREAKARCFYVDGGDVEGVVVAGFLGGGVASVVARGEVEGVQLQYVRDLRLLLGDRNEVLDELGVAVTLGLAVEGELLLWPLLRLCLCPHHVATAVDRTSEAPSQRRRRGAGGGSRSFLNGHRRRSNLWGSRGRCLFDHNRHDLFHRHRHSLWLDSLWLGLGFSSRWGWRLRGGSGFG